MITYSQNFEDVMLERLFGEVKQGFYIDVGAWDPDIHSVTRHFYDKGWSGVNVDPIAARMQAFEIARPRDINLCVAVGSQPGTMTFYECVEESYLSTLDVATAEEMRERGLTVVEHTVPVLTLAEILERHCPRTVDFLKIDVEGFEGELIKGLDLKRYRPRALVIEATRPANAPSSWDEFDSIGTWSSWEPDLLASGYALAHFDGLNRFYLREEDAGLALRLTLPPNVFDFYESAAFQRMKDELAAVEADRGLKDAVIARLSKDLEEVRADQAAKQVVIDGLLKRLESNGLKRSLTQRLKRGAVNP